MPLGIKTAAAWFHRSVDEAIVELVERGVMIAYQDDIIKYTRIKFLGHIISHNVIKTDPKRASCKRDMPKQKNNNTTKHNII